MYSDGDGHMPKWLKWVIGGTVIVAGVIATVATGGAATGTVIAAVHTVASGALLGSAISAGIGMVAGGVNAGIEVASLSSGSYLTRGIMAGIDAALGLGSYFAQNGINGTMNNISFGGAVISFVGGLFDFTTPVNKYFDAIWGPVMTAEIGWAYDVITTAKKTREQSVIVAQY